MIENRQYMALEWVIKDIKDTLLQSQKALESYARESADVIQLKFCLTYIHQVYGSLHMAGFHGAAMIASEIEALVEGLLQGQVGNKKEAVEVLHKAILRLPVYLDQAMKIKRDEPRVIFYLLNDLRAVRGASFLSESTIFSPDLSCLESVNGELTEIAKNPQQFTAVLSKLREMYQYAAASVIHKNSVEKNLQYLLKVSDRLQKILRGSKRAPLWEIVSAFIIGLQKDLIPDNAAIKKLLRQLDDEIKLLSEQGSVALEQASNEDMIKNLLYYLLPLKGAYTEVDKIYDAYGLANASLVAESNEDVVGPVESSAMHSVANAIKEEFLNAKQYLNASDNLDAYNKNAEKIHQCFQRVADTLAILGVGYLRQQMLQNIQYLDYLDSSQPADFSNNHIKTVVDSISNVENQLGETLVQTQEKPDSTSRLFTADEEYALQESRNGLEEAKDAVVNYIATQWNIKNLDPVPDLLRGVSKNLKLLSLTPAVNMLASCASYIEMQLIDQAVEPKWDQLESLADVIASVDYFLEVLSLTKEEDIEILWSAKKGLVNLGIPAARVNQIISSEKLENNEFLSESSTVDVGSESHNAIPDVDANDIDEEEEAEIISIFVEEAEEVLETINEFFPQWKNNNDNENALIEVRRAFHTLKGSGRLVKADDIGELSWAVENMFNRIIDKTLVAEKVHGQLVDKVIELLPTMVKAFSQREETPDKVLCENYQLWANQLSKGNLSGDLVAFLGSDAEEEQGLTDQDVDEPVPVFQPAIDKSVDEQEEDIDPQLWEIFGSEAETHLDIIRQYILKMESARPFFEPPSDAMQRAMHTLKGSAHMAEIESVASIMTPMELFAKDLRGYQVDIDEDILQLIKDSVEYTEYALEQMSRLIYPIIEKKDLFLARVAELRERSVGHLINREDDQGAPKVDPAILEGLMNEGMDLLLGYDAVIEQWKISPDIEQMELLSKELKIVQHAANRANLASMEKLSEHLDNVYQALINKQISLSAAAYEGLFEAHGELLDIIDAMAAGQDLPKVNEPLLVKLTALLNIKDIETKENTPEASEVPNYPEVLSSGENNQLEEQTTNELEADIVDSAQEDIDEEVVEIFMDEAKELIEDLDETIHQWENGGSARESNESIQRLLHTFKGGARLAGLATLGDIAHDFESYLISQIRSETSTELLTTVHQYQDQLIRYVEARAQGELAPEIAYPVQSHSDGNDLKEEKTEESLSESPDSAVEFLPIKDESANVLSFPPQPVPFAEQESSPGVTTVVDGGNAARRLAPQETVKVSSDLMEELVNLAGETSISRGRIEEHMGDLGESLGEMDQTVERLQEQLRRLDIETEAQILFRQEQLAEQDDFDPLEMDRYSQLQQLSRSLIESASDLRDLKATLTDKTRDAETILLQQSRINTELQEGLMRSRMVPFSRVVPRLRRIVRQISTELGKDVNFEFNNSEGEIDRNMMERMIPPLEHMVRNAVDHGIEKADVREKAGKPARGRVTFSLIREGSNVLLYLTDDGAGINVERVRQKAIEQGLMDADVQLSDKEIMEFIFHAGFSTAKEITQISGRGVGMDVVSSEIKALGGSIDISSREGQGTQFVLRLPFTLSVNRALIVGMGEDFYAIPLNTIEGIARISPKELPSYYTDANKRFNYANNEYQLRYLGSFLDRNARPRLDHDLPIPVLLVRTGSHAVALQVDSLQGSREIVVKSLGPQFSSVQGLSGATIMGDGHVVVILDIYGMIRQEYALGHEDFIPEVASSPVQEKEVQRNPLIMVVDDSVTVRKVTVRFLEREGFDVITAKDGLDAVNILQERVPDVMLLDIEMPRMDGFEVARWVRAGSRTKDLPIIMITSRTGEKHRQIGLEAGANEYMGKPYQEDALLNNIRHFISSNSG